MKIFRRCLWIWLAAFAVCSAAVSAGAADIATDVEDPMYLNRLGDFVSRTSFSAGRHFQLRENASYGFSNRFTLAADVRWRSRGEEFESKFSNIGLMGTYRAGEGATGETDVLVGFGVGGHGIAPSYSDEVYSVGVRTGKQWSGMTLSATVMTNWIFDNWSSSAGAPGMAYIDVAPDAYFRLAGGNWAVGAGLVLRKSTVSAFDREWITGKFGTTVGMTGWYVNLGYEVELEEFRIGGALNMLF